MSKSVKFIVTGAAGFIGSQLLKALLEKGVDPQTLLVVDHAEAFKNRPCTRSFRDKVLFEETDTFLSKLSTYQPQSIFHLGACSSTDEYREDFLERVNVDYSKTLWNFARDLGIPFVYASSAATYGNGEEGFDDDPAKMASLKPLNPYGRSKLRFDLWALEEAAAGKAPPTWAGFKFFNVYGPGEEHKAGQASVLWSARRQLREAGEIRLFTSHKEGYRDGEQKRDFVYVGDVVRVLLAFASQKLPSGIYNLGSGRARSFKDLALAVAKAYEREAKIVYVPMPEHLRPHYQYFTEAKIARLQAALPDFKATELEEGIRASVRQIEAENS
jgi:ADP-L-glycero-D-manno-heptose 6-epimerase